jgi:plastocyanin
MRNDASMGILRRGILATLTAGLLLLAGGTVSANAADPIVAADACCSFAPGPYSQFLGDIPIFENPSTADAPHNVTSTAKGPDGGPLFRSRTIAAGDTAPVAGAQYLEGGAYPFFCTLHGPSMSGTLTVDGDTGTFFPRPAIRVWIPSQRLRSVRRSGKLKVRVRAAAASAGIRIVSKRGKLVIGSASNISLAAGKTSTVTVRLSRAGRKAISRGRRQAVSIRGTVAFGSPSAARKVLR